MQYYYNKPHAMNEYKRQMKQMNKTLIKNINERMYENISLLDVTAWHSKEPIKFEQRMTGKKIVLKEGDVWGELFDCAWFNIKGKVPKKAKGKHVVLVLNISGEGCVVNNEGEPIRGITHGYPGKRIVQICKVSDGNENIDIWMDAGCNGLQGNFCEKGALLTARIAICNEIFRKVYYDLEVLWDLVNHLPEKGARHNSIMYMFHRVNNILNEYSIEEMYEVDKIISKEINKKGGDPSLTFSAIGHAHLDLAWLWPIRETKRKAARTFSTAVEMFERYPEYIFGASQPQLYQWVKEEYPSLFNKIKEYVKKGRWELQGAMWVEADTNISGGEALVRQVLYGKRFYKDEFGEEVDHLWLPDVFGYSGALPQILLKSGVTKFLTIKLNWNEINMFPHHSFRWQGIDGSEILSHMPPEGTYNSDALPSSVITAEERYLDKGICENALLLFGIGDGGGGPGAEYIERIKRMENLQGLCPVKQEKSQKFFEKLEEKRSELPVWKGELYFERHRGTYTSQADNKKYNRLMENGLREVEFSSVLMNNEYPKEKLDTLWKETLLYQFHDILPGSSIARVYDESVPRYREMYKETKELYTQNYSNILNNFDTSNMNNPYFVVNSLSWERNEWVKTDDYWMRIKAPSLGACLFDRVVCNSFEDMKVTQNTIESDEYLIAFNEEGNIDSIYDKTNNKEVLDTKKPSNVLQVYYDMNDAWDINQNYQEKIAGYFKPVSKKSYLDGPKAVMEIEYEFGKSKLYQTVFILKGERRIDFQTKVLWHEDIKMLRTSFVVDVFAKEATCDIQFGNLKRPTVRNTSWDYARYEVCAHKWIDLSQKNYGVALLNNCKYGHKVLDNILDINLLRSTDAPGYMMDRGDHEFTYSLLPHQGDYIDGEVQREGYNLNIPLYIQKASIQKGIKMKEFSMLNIDKKNIIVESVKKAEDSDDVIIRMYENSGMDIVAKITFGINVKNIIETNLMEVGTDNIELNENSIYLTFKPFEIKTIKVIK